MKKAICVILTFLFFNGVAQAQSSSRINIFEQRRIVIGEFKNLSDNLYDYINPTIRTTLYTMAESIPFITITEKERLFLQQLSSNEKYRETFSEAQAGIQNKMKTAVTMDLPVDDEFPLVLFGNYNILTPESTTETETLSIVINERNMMTGEEKQVFETTADLENFLNNPQKNLSGFFRNFLTYKTYLASLTVDPPDTLISLDNRLLGTGAVSGILVTPGNHRVTMTRKGYRTFSDLIFFDKDPFFLHVNLQKNPASRRYTLYTVPAGTDMYLDEEYMGKTPVIFYIDSDDQVITLKREGYRTLAVNASKFDKKTGEIEIMMERPEQWDQTAKIADRHKKRGKLLSYAGFGMIGLVILFGTLTTLNQQRADLYADKDTDTYDSSVRLSRLYSTLTVSSSILTLGIFTFSFIETLQYFNLYSSLGNPGTSIPIVQTEVQF